MDVDFFCRIIHVSKCNSLVGDVALFYRNILMKLDNRGPVQISAHLTEVLPGVANWLLQKGVLQVKIFSVHHNEK